MPGPGGSARCSPRHRRIDVLVGGRDIAAVVGDGRAVARAGPRPSVGDRHPDRAARRPRRAWPTCSPGSGCRPAVSRRSSPPRPASRPPQHDARRGQRREPRGARGSGSASRPSTWSRRSSRSTRSSGSATPVPGRRGAPGGQLRRDRPGQRGARPSGPRPAPDPERRAAPSAGLEPPAYVRGQGYAADDLLDACAVAWTAAPVAAGDGGHPARPAGDVLRRPPRRDLGLTGIVRDETVGPRPRNDTFRHGLSRPTAIGRGAGCPERIGA